MEISKLNNYTIKDAEARGDIDLLQRQTGLLQNQITSLSSGSPAGVYPTLSALQNDTNANKNKIYVVSATGNWYYYDTTNNEWVSGGVYQSSVNDSDTSSLLNTSGQIGNLLPLTSNSPGYITSGGVVEYDPLETKMRATVTTEPIPIVSATKISLFVEFTNELNNEVKWFACANYNNEEFISRPTKTNNFDKLTLDNGNVIYRVVFDIPENTTNVRLMYRSYLKARAYYKYGNFTNYIGYIPNKKDLDINYYNLIETNDNFIEYEDGNINTNTGLNFDSTTNIRTKKFLRLNKGSIIKSKEKYMQYQTYEVYVMFYDLNHNFIKYERYLRNRLFNIVLDNDYLIRITLKKSDTTSQTSLQLTDEIREELKDILVIKKVNKNENFTSFYKSYNHRGFDTYPENTLIAFKASKEHGFYGIETDIQFTSDNVPVLLHDARINRTARTSNGNELPDYVSIADITYEQALNYDFGYYKGYPGVKIPTLEELLILAKEIGLNLILEIKASITENNRAKIINDLVKKYSMEKNVMYASAYPGYLRPLFALNPVSDYILIHNDFESNYLVYPKQLKSNYNNVYMQIAQTSPLTDENIQECIDNDVKLSLWINNDETDNSILDIDRCFDYIITDHANTSKIIYDNSI